MQGFVNRFFESRRLLLALYFFFNLSIHFFIVRSYLELSIHSSLLPSAVDSKDYANRAQLFLNDGFKQAFEDTNRMPLYPIFLSLLIWLFDDKAFIAARILQLIGVSLGNTLLAGILLKRTQRLLFFKSICMLILTLLPIWYFIPILIAESFTYITVCILIFFMLEKLNGEHYLRACIFVGATLAVACYLKPNNLLFILWVTFHILVSKPVSFVRKISLITATLTISILPWVFFVNTASSGFVGLTSGSGVNLYIGRGMVIDPSDTEIIEFASECGVSALTNPEYVYENFGATSVQVNKELTTLSLKILRKDFRNQLCYGLRKVGYSLSLTQDKFQDRLIGVFTFVGIVLAFISLLFRNLRGFSLTFLVTLILVSTQAFLFQADRRFTFPVLAPFIFLICSLSIIHGLQVFRSKNFLCCLKNHSLFRSIPKD